MKKHLVSICIINLLFLYCTPGFAQEEKKFALSTTISSNHTGSADIGDAKGKFDDSVFTGISVSYFINKLFSMELSGNYTQTDVYLAFDSNTGALGELRRIPILMTVCMNFPIKSIIANEDTNSRFYLGVGVGYFFNDFDYIKQDGINEFFPLNYETDVDDNFGMHFNIGVEFLVTESCSVLLDIKSLFNKAEFSLKPHSDTIYDSEITDVGLNSLVVGLGFRYYF